MFHRPPRLSEFPLKTRLSKEKIKMAASADKDLGEHIETIRADIATLSETVSQLVNDTAGIQSALKRRVNAAAKHAAATGEHMFNDATAMGEDALDAVAKGANAAVSSVESQITRNPLTSVLIALGFGIAVGLLSRK
jgi:ElaB/YqjD/DUF883 family membrane-anchored ribosome-binding protein